MTLTSKRFLLAALGAFGGVVVAFVAITSLGPRVHREGACAKMNVPGFSP